MNIDEVRQIMNDQLPAALERVLPSVDLASFTLSVEQYKPEEGKVLEGTLLSWLYYRVGEKYVHSHDLISLSEVTEDPRVVNHHLLAQLTSIKIALDKVKHSTT